MSYKEKVLPHLTEEFCEWLVKTAEEREKDRIIHGTRNGIYIITTMPYKKYQYGYPDGDWSSFDDRDNLHDTLINVTEQIYDKDDHDGMELLEFLKKEHEYNPESEITIEFVADILKAFDCEVILVETHEQERKHSSFISPCVKDLKDLMEKLPYKFGRDDIILSRGCCNEVDSTSPYGQGFKPLFRFMENIIEEK